MTLRKILTGGLVSVGAIALIAAYFVIDPSQTVWAPKCMFNVLTGLQCAGCGSQRMVHALLHGDLSSAWHYNAFLLCLLPLLAVMAFAAAFRTRLPRLYAAVNSLPVLIAVGTGIILWSILRNL